MCRELSAIIVAAFIVGVSVSPSEAQTPTQKCSEKSGRVWLVYSGTSEAQVRAERTKQEVSKTFAANTSNFKDKCKCNGTCAPSQASVDTAVTTLPQGTEIKLGPDCTYVVNAVGGVGVTILKGSDNRLTKTPAAGNTCSDNDFFIKVPYQVTCAGKCK